MSFLAPLYALGVLAVGLPILFHLIQRRPKGQLEFSSTMFLAATPPRLTKRSRLENWPLLLLRAAALILLALAFARPFLRSLAQLDAEPPGRQLLVLLDTSASMQREDLWQQALSHLQQLLKEAQASDQIALATFDSEFKPRVTFDQTSGVPSSRRQALINAALGDISPTWFATDLGRALVAAADLLHASAEEAIAPAESDGDAIESSPAKRSQIILVSDMQSGSDVDGLQGYQWPQDIYLDVRPVAVQSSGNAGLTVLASDESAEATAAQESGELRVRVRNTSDSQQQQFRLGWVDDEGRMVEDREYRIQVPPGATRVVRVLRSPTPASQLILQGDDHPFDNTVHVAVTTTLNKQLLYVGDRNDDPRSSLSYYLKRATLDTVRLKVEFQQQLPSEFLLAPDPDEVPLIVVGSAVESEGVSALRSYLNAGGRVLCVLHGPASDEAINNRRTQMIRQLTSLDELVIDEAKIDDYAMFSTIDFQHPLFQPFADPRFNDFTKIHFWSHRTIGTADLEPTELEIAGAASSDPQAEVLEQANLETANRRILVRFHDRSPALIEQRFGAGRLWILTAGWQPLESQLALSTKFVPLLYGMFDPTRGRLVSKDNYTVGQRIELAADPSEDSGAKQIVYPDGTIANVDRSRPLIAPEQPGLYRLIKNGEETSFAVNVGTEESRTTPLDASGLEQHGVPLAQALTATELKTKQRQMRDVELEGGQKLWRWLILATLVILAVETLFGGWLTNRQDSVILAATSPR